MKIIVDANGMIVRYGMDTEEFEADGCTVKFLPDGFALAPYNIGTPENPIFRDPYTQGDCGLTLVQWKILVEKAIRAKSSSLMSQVVIPYSPEERDTWPSQVLEAKAYTENPAAATPMLTALCTQRGNTVADQAAKILTNEAAFKTAVGTILGTQQAKLDLIAAATTAEGVAAITWEGLSA